MGTPRVLASWGKSSTPNPPRPTVCRFTTTLHHLPGRSLVRSQSSFFPPESITIAKKKIGAGASGQVMLGDLDGTPCALKLTNALWFQGLQNTEAMEEFSREVSTE